MKGLREYKRVNSAVIHAAEDVRTDRAWNNGFAWGVGVCLVARLLGWLL